METTIQGLGFKGRYKKVAIGNTLPKSEIVTKNGTYLIMVILGRGILSTYDLLRSRRGTFSLS